MPNTTSRASLWQKVAEERTLPCRLWDSTTNIIEFFLEQEYLLQRSKVTVVESSPTIPNPHGSSVDTSRIVRADYANAAYSKLAAAAIHRWRSTDWGRDGRYTQNGLLLVQSNLNTEAGGGAKR